MKIKVEDLKFAYGMRKVLNGVTASFDEGKIYGIVGKNGAGKTTFFKALTNIITNYSGTVSYNDENVLKNSSVLTKTGILLDDIELYKSYTGWFNLRYFGGLRGNFDEDLARKLADELDLLASLDLKVSAYSLGMGKKLLLLISLMNEAEVLIFDEPLRGIDAKSVLWFRQYLLNLKQTGKTISISSHVQEDIEALCDEVFVLADGTFTEAFDLTDTRQMLRYKVVVSDPSVLTEVLKNEGHAYEQREESIIFEATPEQFQTIFQACVSRDLMFEEIKKESKFAEFVK